jgi:hypothetical protein
MRGDKSFAYDLIVRYGPVSSRVALLLRSAEGKPPSTRFVFFFKTLHLLSYSNRVSKGGPTGSQGTGEIPSQARASRTQVVRDLYMKGGRAGEIPTSALPSQPVSRSLGRGEYIL